MIVIFSWLYIQLIYILIKISNRVFLAKKRCAEAPTPKKLMMWLLWQTYRNLTRTPSLFKIPKMMTKFVLWFPEDWWEPLPISAHILPSRSHYILSVHTYHPRSPNNHPNVCRPKQDKLYLKTCPNDWLILNNWLREYFSAGAKLPFRAIALEEKSFFIQILITIGFANCRIG